MSSNKVYVGIDLGGTKTNIAIIDDNGQIVSSRKIYTQGADEDSISVVRKIIEVTRTLISEIDAGKAVMSIGIGVPGTVERKEGTVLFAPNLGWKDVPVRKLFVEVFNIPVYIGQDTEAAALGEFHYGAGKGMKDIACITVGTGVGCGLIIDGKLHKGKYFTAGEFGHTLVERDGLRCNCGRNGCLEAYASGTAIIKRFKMEVEKGRCTSLTSRKSITEIRSEDIFDEAKKGDNLALSIINDAVDYLSMGITNIINLICPEAVILSGGIGTEKELFINPLIGKAYSRIYSLLVDKVKITTAELGEYAPLIGAAMLFKDPLYSQTERVEELC